MGVKPEHHGRGIGTALLAAAEDALRGRGVEYLQVKTLGPSRESRAPTRAFYEARGSVPLEELADFWPGQPGAVARQEAGSNAELSPAAMLRAISTIALV